MENLSSATRKRNTVTEKEILNLFKKARVEVKKVKNGKESADFSGFGFDEQTINALNDLPDEVQLSLLYFRKEALLYEKISPLILKTQFYGVVEVCHSLVSKKNCLESFRNIFGKKKKKNATEIDRTLDLLHKEGRIKLFCLPKKPNSWYLVFVSDYKKIIEKVKEKVVKEQAAKVLERKKRKTVERMHVVDGVLFERFKKKMSHWKSLRIREKKLLSVLSTKEWKCQEEDLIELVRSGLLLAENDKVYWLTVPNAGTFYTFAEEGDKQIIKILSRTNFGEMREEELFVKAANYNLPLGTRFHVDHLLGLQKIKRVNTNNGFLVKLSE